MGTVFDQDPCGRKASAAPVDYDSKEQAGYVEAEKPSTDSLRQLGVRKTTLELVEAQRSPQFTRLSGSTAGRRLLEAAGLQPRYSPSETAQVGENVLGTYVAGAFPRNVHQRHNAGRQAARARAILNKRVGLEASVNVA
ncbi:hypothetical protein HPB50_013763 [Hyalomma asiaticum]|uniref:Uncharacterized protein n=1 Tax=Hyalomma asiaticum TaxID=266040 RepID=A0ACB7S4Z2_HYAAI|nr:hypothetical protein HPB50_013763 [Hyalomma asiaticum]